MVISQEGRGFRRRLLIAGATLGGCVAVSLAASASTALASTTVPCSAQGAGLVAAVDAGNSGGGGTIKLAAGCTYHLSGVNNSNPGTGSNALPIITSPITIKGDGATVAGDGSARIVEVDGPNGNLTINGLTITGGDESASGGGGILNHGATLTLIRSSVTGNTAFGGGGIATGKGNPFSGTSFTTLNKSRVDNNTGNGTPMMGGGGGIANGGTLVVNNSEIANNTAPGANAGGLLNHDSATLNKTKITDNATDGFGGGVANLNLGLPSTPTVTLRLNSSRVTDNSALGGGGGIFNLSFGSGAAIVNLNPHTQVTGNSPDNCEPPGTIARCTG